ncbi:ABC transporter ATP-binding protein [Microbacterium betulae]|uniref:ABC transporter ATP-binding protein n=1 Tax=Microbacterium betulae TaxID=2981139 RepID=A0AA97FFV0_9MICO|nr:ABC transporter ATP-binding protein [Microbacterium sp. AB]WOF21873.1 ABC transporter ATP-binding protein [Microbacterium sp. AB]
MIRRLARIALPAWPWLAASLLARVAGLAAGVALLAVPAWGAVVAVDGDLDVVLLAVVLVSLAAAKGVLRYLEQFLGHRAAFDLIADMRLRFYDAVVPLAPGELEADSGTLASIAARDIDRVEVFFAHTIVPALAAVLVPGAVTAWAFLTGPVEGAVVLGAFLVGGAVVPLLGRRASARAARGLLAERAAIAQHVAEDVAGRAEIRALHAEETRLAALDDLSARAGRHLRASGLVQAQRAFAGLLWPSAAVLALLALGAAAPEHRLVLAAAVIGAAPALTAVEAFARSLPLALAAARRYLGVLDRVPAVADPVRPSVLPEGPLPVRVDAVRFRYPGSDAPVLDDVSLDVPARGRVALLGPSGSGKSTIASLLLRVHDPEHGRVLVGGVDVRDLALGDLRRAVALVEQRTVLVSGTVLDNLRLGAPRLTEAEAWSALEDASLADDVRAHPDGLDARVAEDALSLSGGQRQRLGLARALARRPRVLVLDEATSHQDVLTQRAIRLAIAKRPDLTAVVIAHRADAVAGMDRVIRLRGRPVRSRKTLTPHDRAPQARNADCAAPTPEGD